MRETCVLLPLIKKFLKKKNTSAKVLKCVKWADRKGG